VVYGCGWKAAPFYILAELIGGVLAALVSWPLYGTGLQLGRWWDMAEGAAREGYARLEGAVHAHQSGSNAA
jgi:hypothetical protein